MKRYSPDMQFGGYGDCPAPCMEEDDQGDYVEYQPWMATVTEEELAELRRDRERLEWMISQGAACGEARGGFSCHHGEHGDVAFGGTARQSIDRARGAK